LRVVNCDIDNQSLVSLVQSREDGKRDGDEEGVTKEH
jgi:hypothetical protein